MTAKAITTTLFNYGALDNGRAALLRRLGVEINAVAAQGIYEIGKRLKKARKCFGSATDRRQARGDATWAAWCDDVAGIALNTAGRYIQIYEMIDAAPAQHRQRLLITFKALAFLAVKSVPEAAVKAALKEAETTKVTGPRAKEIIREHMPLPATARAKAKETGVPQPASDGKIYTGVSEEEAEAEAARRELTYAVRDAVDLIARVAVTPAEWLDLAASWRVREFQDNDEVGKAANWLSELKAEWERRRDKQET